MVVINSSHFPLVTHSFTDVVTHQEVVSHTKALEALFRKREKFASVVLARKMELEQRNRSMEYHAQWFRDHLEECQTWWTGVGFAFTSVVPRFLFSSFLLLVPLPFPYETFSTYEDALGYTSQSLRNAQVSLPLTLPSEP